MGGVLFAQRPKTKIHRQRPLKLAGKQIPSPKRLELTMFSRAKNYFTE